MARRLPVATGYVVPYTTGEKISPYFFPYTIEEIAPPVRVAEAAPVAKPFPWKWVIFGGIGLLVAYSIFKK